MKFGDLLKLAVDQGASDLHVQAESAPILRQAGKIHPIDAPAVSEAELAEFIAAIAPIQFRADVLAAARNGLDFSYQSPGAGRFRCSAYCTMGRLGVVFRLVRSTVPPFEELSLPPVVHDIALTGRGLTLVTGTTGSGKSTTLAAMIDAINATEARKIITIEDPIEYVHEPKKSFISQLELGADTPSFDQALRQALRQDPDVILVGELRDVETLRMALRAADTGHQVFATVHSSRAALTIERVIAMFPPAEHRILLSQLSHCIEAIISQRLILAQDGKRRPAVEILRGGPVTEKFILDNKLNELSAYIEAGTSGMQTFDQHLMQMYQKKLISGTEAIRHASRPEALAVALRGVKHIGTVTTG